MIPDHELDKVTRIKAGFGMLLKQSFLTEDEAVRRIAEALGKSRRYVWKALEIAKHPYFDEIADFLVPILAPAKSFYPTIWNLSELFSINGPEVLKNILQKALEESWSSEKIRHFIETYKEERKHAGRLVKKPEKLVEKVEEKALEAEDGESHTSGITIPYLT